MNIEARLAEMAIILPEAPKPVEAPKPAPQPAPAAPPPMNVFIVNVRSAVTTPNRKSAHDRTK